MKQLLPLILLFVAQNTIAQNVGIGTTTPKSSFNVAANKTVLFGLDTSGGGSKLIWYPAKSAFRTGFLDVTGSNFWDNSNIGNYSFASGLNTQASGEGATAMGEKTLANGQYSTALGLSDTASGLYSTAMGFNNKASGRNSTAMGFSNNATGLYSTAMGYGTFPSGNVSTAMGYKTQAGGAAAIAMGGYTNAKGNNAMATGLGTTAPSYIETAIGSYNTDYTGDGQQWISTDRLFTIGNGQDENSKADALVILKNGNTGIGVSNPAAGLHIGLNKTVLFGTDSSGEGSKLLWYPSKAAFRAGFLAPGDTFWNYDQIGLYSFAGGGRNLASGLASTAVGFANRSTGTESNIVGSRCYATGDYSIAVGHSANANGFGAAAIGTLSSAYGTYATAVGFDADAPGEYAMAVGPNTVARSYREIAMGSTNSDYIPSSTTAWVATDRSFSIGNGSANERRDGMVMLKNGNTGFGSSNPQKSFEVVGDPGAIPITLVIGNKGGFGSAAMEFVSDYGTPSQWRPGYIKSNDLGIFTGSLEFYTNGSGTTSLYNSVKGFEVTNGKAYTATGTVFSFSDARLKNNITPFTDGLNVISKINPVNFYYNADAPFKTAIQQTGIVAQELEQVAPYMVEKNKEAGYEDLRSVNNQAYTFLLINAVKELQSQIEALKKDNLEMKKQIDKIIKAK